MQKFRIREIEIEAPGRQGRRPRLDRVPGEDRERVPAGADEALSRCLDTDSARRVVAFEIDAQVQDKIHQLAVAANEGTLDPQGRSEYEALISAADFVTILKLKARQQLHRDAA